MKTQVAIVGAGPAGLTLGHLLHLYGIDSAIIENHSRGYVTERVRAGVLEHHTVDLLIATGLGERLKREGMRHEGVYFAFGGKRRHINFADLTGRAITVYGQNELVRDLIEARVASGQPLYFDAEGVGISGLDSCGGKVRFRVGGDDREVACDFIAGCDGFHGICRASIPPGVLTSYESTWPFAWLGILAAAAP